MNGKLTKEFANKVYDVLVKTAEADEFWRGNFVHYHTADEMGGCWEYRFQGIFGFGGKYWSESNKVTYYPEDATPALDKLLVKVNKLLGEIK